jgi:hypothetical protein
LLCAFEPGKHRAHLIAAGPQGACTAQQRYEQDKLYPAGKLYPGRFGILFGLCSSTPLRHA